MPPFRGKSLENCLILTHYLAGSAGCVQHIETLARPNWAEKLQNVTEMRQVGGRSQTRRIFTPHPLPRIQYGAGTRLPSSSEKGILSGGVGPSWRG